MMKKVTSEPIFSYIPSFVKVYFVKELGKSDCTVVALYDNRRQPTGHSRRVYQ